MRAWAAFLCPVVLACGCSKGGGRGTEEGGAPGAASSASPSASPSASATAGTVAEAGGACPDDMVHVETSFCPDVERRCLDMEHEQTNHLEICHAFAHEQRCRTEERKLAFCIDRYEYPNKKGGHPVWMLDWYQAQATCESK
ncbi:MAG TPA: hypothetical protein VIF09_03015, partial [Polyangiaceae bacterium]